MRLLSLAFFFLLNVSLIASSVPATIKITSSAFKDGEKIPRKYTCDDSDVSPPLEIKNVPTGTRSLVLMLEDPDAQRSVFLHWLLYNLPGNNQSLTEKIQALAKLDNGAIHGQNNFTSNPEYPILGYRGPCPPNGTHRYFFRVYALNKVLTLPPGATKNQVLIAMKDHVIAEGLLMGRYSRGSEEKK